MPQLAEREHLAAKPRGRAGVAAIGAHDLERAQRTGRHAREIHLAHAAGAERTEDLVAVDDLPDHARAIVSLGTRSRELTAAGAASARCVNASSVRAGQQLVDDLLELART